jgi:hypothetical protein
MLFETLLPRSTFTLPSERAFEALAFGLRVTNHGDRPQRVLTYRTIVPELRDAAGRAVPLEGGSNRSRLAREEDCPLLSPGGSTTWMMDAALRRGEGDEFRIAWSDEAEGTWQFRGIRPGTYTLRISYTNRNETLWIHQPSGRRLRDLWTGHVTTPGKAIRFQAP